MSNKIFLDVETTGINHVLYDIVQLAAIIQIDGQDYTFNEYCQPINMDNIDPIALQVNKLTIPQLKTFQSPLQMWTNFMNWLDSLNQKSLLISGYNVGFDQKHIKSAFSKLKLPEELYNKYFKANYLYDVFTLVKENKKTIPTLNNKLETLAKFFNIEIFKRNIF